MYNEDRKMRFLSEEGLLDQRPWAVVALKNVQLMEQELSKDLAEFTAEEVGAALGTTGVVSAATIANRIPLIVRYKKWCAEQGFKTVPVLSEEIHADIADNIRDTMVYSPAHLAFLLKKAFPDTNRKSSRCIYRAYLWMGFAGMTREEAVSAKVSDMDWNTGMIFANNRYYRIPDEGIPDLRAACRAKEFIRVVSGQERTFRREEGDTILRGRYLQKKPTPEAYIRSTLRPTVQLGFAGIGHNGMSFVKIRKSGLFYELLSREVHGLAVSFATIAHDDYLAGGYKESKGNPKQKVIRRIMLMYERDYAAWKSAFETELKEEFGIGEMPVQE